MIRAVVVATYGVLAAILAWTRLDGLGRSYWHDEIVTVADFVKAGPGEIVAGNYIPNNHELFSLIGWATSSLVGDSEVALRLWSVVPFLAGVALVTVWLDRNLDHLSGILFLFLATVSPLLLDITRQARGYGLAFFAMAVLVVAALEAMRRGGAWPIVAACAAGVVGTATLSIFGVAFVATCAVLVVDRRTRRIAALGLAVSAALIAIWYSPHVEDLFRSSRQDYGVPIEPWWLVTAPIDQILLPGLIWIDGTVLFPRLIWIPVVAVALVLMTSSSLLRNRYEALVLGVGPMATILALFLTDTRAVPRFLSFLLVPLLMLAASGVASIFERLPTRPAPVRTITALAVLGALGAAFVTSGLDVVRMPREAHKEAVQAVQARGWGRLPIFAYVIHPRDLGFYLGRQPRAGQDPDFASAVCSQTKPVVLVVQPWVVEPTEFPCTRRAGAEHVRLEQYTRGREIDVWLVPPSRSRSGAEVLDPRRRQAGVAAAYASGAGSTLEGRDDCVARAATSPPVTAARAGNPPRRYCRA